MAENKKDRVGIVGAGAWGFPCSSTSSSKGYTVTVCDISEQQREAARAVGRGDCQNPGEVGKASDIVILGVGYDDEVNDVVFGKDGLFESMAPGSIIAVSSTSKPDTVKAVAARVARKRHRSARCSDLPRPFRRRFRHAVGAGWRQARRRRARPAGLFGTFASDIVHLGDVGHGQVGKTMNNLLLWVNAVGLLEAGRLAETTGIDLVRLREALMMSSGASDALKEWDMISFTWALKDMQIVADMTDKAGLSLPITGAIKELVKEARRVKASNPPNWTGNKPVKYG